MYKGSICSWTYYNVFLYNNFPDTNAPSKSLKSHRVWLQIILWFTVILGIPLMFCVTLSVMIITLIRQLLCCGLCGKCGKMDKDTNKEKIYWHETIFGEFVMSRFRAHANVILYITYMVG